MSYLDIEQRPAKKRRFFVEESPVVDRTLQHGPTLSDEVDALPTSPPSLGNKDSANGTVSPASSQLNGTRADAGGKGKHNAPETQGEHAEGFDTGTFASFVGEEVEPETLSRLREAAGGDMERGMGLRHMIEKAVSD